MYTNRNRYITSNLVLCIDLDHYYCLKGESTSSIEMKTTYSCNMKALRSSCYEFYTTRYVHNENSIS